jgi:glycosyltransferase involved in cell wall biosynthesis
VSAAVTSRVGVVMPLAVQRGGAEMALLHFLDGLKPESKSLISLCFLEAGPMVEWARERGYSTAVVPTGRLRELVSWSRAVRALYQWLVQNHIRVVLSWMGKAHLYAGPAAWWANVPALWWQHAVPAPGGIERLVSLVPARRIIASSRAVAEAQRRLSGRKTQLVTVHPGIDLERLQLSDSQRVGRAALGLPSDALVIGIVARMERCKGIEILMHAFSRLLPQHPALHLLIVGGVHPLQPEYAAQVLRLPAELGIEQHVTLCGHQSDVARWMCEMDIVVSTTFGEGFGMVIVEAMALGKAVVATRSGGVPEIVNDGIDGRLVPPGDIAALVRVLSQLIDSPQARRTLGEAAQRRANDFSVPRFVNQVRTAIGEPL